MLEYTVTLTDALTPITLISGVGLLLLAMTARYNYTTDRVRALLKERRQKAPEIDRQLEKSIQITYERSHLLKNAILSVTTSAAFSGILVLVTILEHLWDLNLEVWKSTMLLTAVVFIVVSTIYFVLEVQISLKTLAGYLKNIFSSEWDE